MTAVKNLRWWIAGLLALATALNYVDRQSFPVVVGEIRKEFPISNEQYASLTSAFLLAYALMYAAGGRIMDWLGTRVGYTVMIIWWSGANALTGLASSVLGLGVFRFLLGMGEGGGFPGSGKAVAEWFPARERSLAFGIFNTGSALGSIIAAPLSAVVVTHLGWRWVFFITGGVGFVWAAVWFKLYQPPEKNRLISAEERNLIAAAHADGLSPHDDPSVRISWLKLFTYPEVTGLMVAKFIADAGGYFFLFWLPKYLGDVRHLDIKEIGYFAWIPFAFAGLGSMSGGWIGSFLLRRNLSLGLARKIALGIAAALIPASLFIVSAPLSLAIVFYGLALFAHQFWTANIMTLPADLFPARVVGSVEGLLGSAGSLGGMFFGLAMGWLVEREGYGPAFAITGLLHPLAFLVVLLTVRQVRPLSL
jgi:ACS family hexuronate transporter-like MFS transporter